jgi:putative aminopeptidase FrvX
MRDKFIPRKSYTDKICNILKKNGIKYQAEVESSGSSDGGYLQKTPYQIDWGFVGIPEKGNHSSQEKVSVHDVKEMVKTYEILMREL